MSQYINKFQEKVNLLKDAEIISYPIAVNYVIKQSA